MRISDGSADVCSSDLLQASANRTWFGANRGQQVGRRGRSQTPQPRSGSCPERNARTSEKRKRAISAVSRKKVSPVLGRNTKADDREIGRASCRARGCQAV